jgi:hypothetical protein
MSLLLGFLKGDFVAHHYYWNFFIWSISIPISSSEANGELWLIYSFSHLEPTCRDGDVELVDRWTRVVWSVPSIVGYYAFKKMYS